MILFVYLQKKISMKKLLSLFLILVLLSPFFASCKKDKGDPPVLPPAESMKIDFSNFDSQKKSALSVPDLKGTENSSWEFAAFAAGTWQIIIGTTLYVPVASFQLAIDKTPTYVSEKNWQWSYSATIAGVVYKARLTGQIRSTDVEWKMYITKEGSYTDFLWFDGTSLLDGTGGTWTLYESNVSPTALIKIDWTKTGTTIGKIKYSYVKNGVFKDSYIEYGLTTATLNAYYKIHYYNGAKFSDLDVEWSTTQHNGRVKSIDYLGDNEWHYWDANRVNTTAP
jgi:hypothetical protein